MSAPANVLIPNCIHVFTYQVSEKDSTVGKQVSDRLAVESIEEVMGRFFTKPHCLLFLAKAPTSAAGGGVVVDTTSTVTADAASAIEIDLSD